MSSGFIKCRIVIWGITGMREGGTAVCPKKKQDKYFIFIGKPLHLSAVGKFRQLEKEV